MLKKLEFDALTADLAAIESLLASRSEKEDPIGYYQYASKKEELEELLAELDHKIVGHAELGVFFGGGPVLGSHGINADFAGKALEELQALITKRFSGEERGQLKQRGRIPLAEQSKMLVTDVARGSFGFILEEAGDTAEITETPLRAVVEEVTDVLSRVGSEDEAIFDEAVAAFDERFLVSLRNFFVLLDDQSATMRVVNGNRDFLLDHHAVSLARNRVQDIQINERGEEFIGTIYLLPAARRFELETQVDGIPKTFIGSVSRQAAAQIAGQKDMDVKPIDVRQISQHPWRVEILTRQIRERNRAPRLVYTLLELKEPVIVKS